MAADVIAQAFVEVLPDLKQFQGDLKKDLNNAIGGGKVGADAGRKTGRSFVGGVGGSLKKLAGTIGAAFAAREIVQFFGSAIKEASDLGESVNAVNVVFGKAAKGILDLGRDSATAFGLSSTEFNELAVRFSNFAQTVAGPGGNVAKTIEEMTRRATDFASVMNLDVAEAAGIFQSALAGETEPLRRFGIDLSAAAVSAFAVKEGISESAASMTEAEKVQARYALLMRETSKTQGDFANTSDSLANRQRILGAQWTDFKATLGAALLPAAEAVLGVFADLIPTLVDLGHSLEPILGPAIRGTVKFFKDLFSSFKGGKGASSGLGKALSTIGDTLQDLFNAVRPIAQQFFAVLGPALQQIGSLIGNTLIPAFANFFAIVRPILTFLIQIVGGALIGAFEGAITFISGALEVISGILNVFVALFRGDWSGLWNGIKQIAQGIWNVIKGAFQVFINLGIVRLLRLGLNVIKAIWTSIWNAIRAVARAVWNGIVAVIRGAVSVIRSILNFFRGLVNLIGTPFRAAWNFIRRVLSSMVNGIRTATNKIGNFFSGIWEALKGGARAAVNFAIRIVNGVIGAINAVIRGVNNLPFVDIGQIPSIPLLAEGGIADRATLAVIGEGSEPEAVLPLSKLQALLDNAGGTTNMAPEFEIRVFIGNEELTGMMDVRVRERERNIRRQVRRTR